MKSVFASRTIWVNVVIALAVLLPTPVQHWVQTHADFILIGSNLLNIALRTITHRAVQLFPD